MKTLKQINLNKKKVIVRVDFNVPIENGEIVDDNRIRESLETINYLLNKNCRIVLLSHLGRIKKEQDKEKNSLKVVAKKLSLLLDTPVYFSEATKGEKLEKMIDEMTFGQILLIENTRFEDLNNNAESGCSEELSDYWSTFGDVFINDAYATAHRSHASNVGLAKRLPSAIGFLIEKELKYVEAMIKEPEHPFIVILGGAKVKDKIRVIENLVQVADKILVCGGMACTFYKAKGYEIGKSLLDEESINFCKTMLEKYPDKIVIPDDVVTGQEFSPDTVVRTCLIDDIRTNEMVMDIGNNTVNKFNDYLKTAKNIIWNGPAGVFEFDKFSKGTRKLAELLVDYKAKTIIGGGDSVSAINKFGLTDKFYYISTGGGATLNLLEGEPLVALQAMDEK